MTVIPKDYRIWSFDGQYADMKPAAARSSFSEFMEAREFRKEQLRTLLLANGLRLETTDAGVQDLNDWFVANAAPDPAVAGQLAREWLSISHDIAIFLGDLVIGRHPQLYWTLFTWGRKSVSFQRPVIMGMSTVDEKYHANVDYIGGVVTYAQRIIEKHRSIPSYGSVNVRGVTIDVDEIDARFRAKELDEEKFWHWLQNAAHRA